MKAVIGLEVHARLETRTKLFCGCLSAFGGEPNTRVCPVCLGLPGTLPVPNREAVRLAIRLVAAVGARVHERSLWARKSYFYPDLPKGYQITQLDRPLATCGRARIEPRGQEPRWIRIERIHLEEDAGKSVHEGLGEDVTGIDFNRCGVPLVEIVSAPELSTPDEACLFLVRLRSILRETGVSDADMEKGSMRCDANVSVHAEGTERGERVEIKNLNSFRHVRRALEFELQRQSGVLASGRTVRRETRSWDERAGETRTLRGKEAAEDYRYFPEPDLPALVFDEELIGEALADMPELAHDRLDRFVAELGLAPGDAARLTKRPDLADYFERVAGASGAPRRAAAWILTDLLGLLRSRGVDIGRSPVGPGRMAELVKLVETGALSGAAAKSVLREMCEGDARPGEIVASRRLEPVTAPDAIEAVCREVVARHEREAEDYRRGKTGLLDFLVGQVMKRSSGNTEPRLAREILLRLLDEGGGDA